MNISLQQIELPDFGMSPELPELSAGEFERRFEAALQQMHAWNLDFLLVFADREHSANLAYLTNLDPRFEEALLILDGRGRRKLLLGNECMGYRGMVKIPMEYELVQIFSLMGQDRSQSRYLIDILSEMGIGRGKKVGCAYYKHMGRPELLEIPAYLADVLRYLVGQEGAVVNANDIFTHNDTGLRHHNKLEELVRFEWASCRSSESIKNLVRLLRPGIREYELAVHFQSDGLPYSCHPMISSGEKAKMGLSSPSANLIQEGDAFTSCLGVQGALTCRAGIVGRGPEVLEDGVRDFYAAYWKNYVATVFTWYEQVGIGVYAADVCCAVEAVRDKHLFDFAVNTGHTLHLDEWVNSPFYVDSPTRLYSGMALQMDIIPVSRQAFVCANMEDGIALADEDMRSDWAMQFPASWERIQARRTFMTAQLGIKLREEVLPLSNIPAYYAPFMLSNDWVAVNK